MASSKKVKVRHKPHTRIEKRGDDYVKVRYQPGETFQANPSELKAFKDRLEVIEQVKKTKEPGKSDPPSGVKVDPDR